MEHYPHPNNDDTDTERWLSEGGSNFEHESDQNTESDTSTETDPLDEQK